MTYIPSLPHFLLYNTYIIKSKLKEQKINVTIDENVKELIAKQGINKAFGARPLRRTIQNLVEDSLAEAILSNDFDNFETTHKKHITLTVEAERIIVK